jgi:thiol-disulfide isomerase/thioredoxin
VVDDRNIHGPLSFVIPSSVAGYALLHERHGRLPLREVLAPAVALARRGLPQDWHTTLKIAASAAVLRRYAESARIYLPNDLPPIVPYQGAPGFLAQGNLAATLERLQQKMGDKDVLVIALSIDRGGIDTVREFFAGVGVKALPVFVDPTMRAQSTLSAFGLPTTIIIDRDGKERGRLLGPAEWDSDRAIDLVQAAMTPAK